MFRLLGFDVRVRPGFVMFLVLIVVLYGDGFGIWLAASLAGFTLLHELGHAVAARHHGAAASISLDFLAGYTSYRPTRELERSERAIISFAGPGIHIAAAVAVLVAMGIDPFDRTSIGTSDAGMAVWWAGLVIGAINLVPVLPLDGGHLAQTGLERWLGPRAQPVMVRFSLAFTVAAAVWCLLDPDRRFYLIFVGFLLIAQFQLLGSLRRSESAADAGAVDSGAVDSMTRQAAAAADAERSAWRTGRSGMLLPGQELSPWYRAYLALRGGRADEARDLLVDGLSNPEPPRWWPPDAASTDQLAPLVAVLPRPFPSGNPLGEHVLADTLLRLGDPEAAGRYAAESFGRSGSAASALIVARAAAAVGDAPMAVKWLDAATTAPGVNRTALDAAITAAPELAALRHPPRP